MSQMSMPEIPMPDLKVVAEMQMAIASRLVDVHKAKQAGKPIVWCSVVLPKEILYAMDVTSVYAELIGGYASIFGLAGKYCSVVEDKGLSRDVCAVHRSAVGIALAETRDDFYAASFAEPDLVLVNNFACMSESRSSLLVADKFKAPKYVVDTPINTWGRGEIPDHAVKYYAEQLKGMIEFLEDHGYTMDWDRLEEEVAFSKALNTLLAEIEDCRKAIPTPMKAYDTVIVATAPLGLSKEARKLEIFERLRDELRERVDKGIGVVDDERLRLLWIGIPPLCDFKLLNYPERHGAVVAKSMLEFLTGFTLDPDLIDPSKPLESIARAQLASPANPLYQGVIDYLVDAAREYKVDGVISVVKRTCGLIPGMQRLTKEAIARELGIPAVIFDLDGVDEREYDAVATKAQLDDFVETLLARKGG